eukprot:2143767-Rhodomonas_salina.1
MSEASSRDMNLDATEGELRQDTKRIRHESGRGDLPMDDTPGEDEYRSPMDTNMTGDARTASLRPEETRLLPSAGSAAAAAAAGNMDDPSNAEANATSLARAKAFHQLYTTGKL